MQAQGQNTPNGREKFTVIQGSLLNTLLSKRRLDTELDPDYVGGIAAIAFAHIGKVRPLHIPMRF